MFPAENLGTAVGAEDDELAVPVGVRLHDDGQVGVVRVLELGANAEVILFRVSQGEHDLAHDFCGEDGGAVAGIEGGSEFDNVTGHHPGPGDDREERFEDGPIDSAWFGGPSAGEKGKGCRFSSRSLNVSPCRNVGSRSCGRCRAMDGDVSFATRR